MFNSGIIRGINVCCPTLILVGEADLAFLLDNSVMFCSQLFILSPKVENP
ncbi:unnamed protein product [Meloidogyne enterolobii]|uniref:Uncharacterized protein n=1 Tax=Meloidogyne enterolobii TaxID=390850 RepID=A0ACB0XRB6_MELEN